MAMYDSDYNGGQVDEGVGLGRSSFIPTLQSAPTSSTTTFTLGTDTISFRVGMMCRVADQTAPNGYIFYRLIDVTSGVATWEVVITKEMLTALFTQNTSAASVSGARVPILNSDGAAIGSDTMPHLASVVFDLGNKYNVDLNTCVNNEDFYASTSDSANNHFPAGNTGGYVSVRKKAITGTVDFVWQKFFSTANTYYIRFGRIDSGVISFNNAWKEL